MKILDKGQVIFCILLTLFCLTIPTSKLLANAVPVEKNMHQVKKKSLHNKKRTVKRALKKHSISSIKKPQQQQQQSYFGIQGFLIFLVVLILVFATALALFIAGLVLNISAMWIPCLVLISIPLLFMLIFFLMSVGRK